MRTLIVAGDYPWPENAGSRLRLATAVGGLARVGPTDLVSVVRETRTDFDPPPHIPGLERTGRVVFDNRTDSGLDLVGTLTRPSKPLGLQWRQAPRIRQGVIDFIRGRYDLVWYFGIRAWAQVGNLSEAPVILDLEDLEDRKIRARLALDDRTGAGLVRRAQRGLGHVLSREDARRWHRLQVAAARRASVTVVCSDLDARRATEDGLPRVEVIPNAYPKVTDPVGRSTINDPPVVMFPGLLTYPPNVLAAEFLATEIGPELRRHLPEVRIRLVGHAAPELHRLDDPPNVTVTGQVPSMEEELARADLVIVPLRYGSGTRLKIVEAFAQKVPVVSTTVGAEGLGATDGEHLLVADDTAGLVSACLRLLTDVGLRSRLVEHAHRLFLEEFQRERIETRIGALGLRVTDVGDRR